MAFSSAITDRTIMGNKRVNFGTFTQANGDTGGAVVTGLQTVDHFNATGGLTAVNASGTVTITTANPLGAQTGYWMAVGI